MLIRKFTNFQLLSNKKTTWIDVFFESLYKDIPKYEELGNDNNLGEILFRWLNWLNNVDRVVRTSNAIKSYKFILEVI